MRKLILFLVLGTTAQIARAVQTDGRMVRLPPLFVTGDNPLQWRYVAMPGFEILSCCPDSLTETFTRRVYLNQVLLDAIVPADLQAAGTVPTTVVLLTEEAAQGMVRKVDAVAQERSRQTNEALAKLGTPSVWKSSGTIPQIKLQDADSMGIDLVLGDNSRDFEFDPAYVFFELEERKPTPPLWFVEGILNFRYRPPYNGFDITGGEDNMVVSVPPSLWISPEVRAFVRACSVDASGDRTDSFLFPLLMKRLVPYAKELTEPLPPAGGTEPPRSAGARSLAQIRRLFSGPPPPGGSTKQKEQWLYTRLSFNGLLPNGNNRVAMAHKLDTGETQVDFLLDHGGDADSPWQLDLWKFQSGLLQRIVFEGMSLRRVLTEPPPPAATVADKELWFEKAGLGAPPGRAPTGLLTLRRTQRVLRHGADADSPFRLDVWKAQAALFVRWAFDDPTQARRQALWQLARSASAAPITDETFQGIFGLSFDEMNRTLQAYLFRATREPFVLFARGAIQVPEVSTGPDESVLNSGWGDFGRKRPDGLQLRDSTETEKARILGDWERKEIDFVRDGAPEFSDLYVNQSQETLVGDYAKGDRDPGLLAAIGLYECAVHDDGHAAEFLDAAVRAGVARPRAYVELARIRLNSALARPAGIGGRIDRAQVASVVDLLQATRAFRPPQLLAYLLAAEAWEHADIAPTSGNVQMLDEGLGLFPDDPRLILATAQLDAAAGERGAALRLVSRGLEQVSDPRIRKLLETLRARYGAGS